MKVKTPIIIIAILFIGIAIPKLTVHDLVSVDERMKRCVNYAISESYDNPIERIALFLGKSRVISVNEYQSDAGVESYTLFRIPLGVLRGQPDATLGVTCDFAADSWNSQINRNFPLNDGEEEERLGIFHDSLVENGLKSYQSDRLGVSLKYPENFRLFEGKGLGAGGVEYYVITMFPEPYISEILTSDADTEWPASMHISFFKNTDMLPLEEWIRTKQYSNFVPSDPAQEGVLTPTTVAGVPAITYHVSGLYESDYIAFKHGEWIVLAVADDMGENTERNFQTVIDSLQLSVTAASGVSAWKTYANPARDFTFQYPSEYRIIDDQETIPNIGRWVQVALQGNAAFISVYGETTVQRCFRNLCDRPAEEQFTHNGIVWDYLGNTSYCDAGECSTPHLTYRTLYGDMAYYLLFSSSATAERVLETFAFSK